MKGTNCLAKTFGIADLIREKREGLGLTQKAFAELLGMPDTGERTVGGWERGEHSPTPAKQAQIENLPNTALLRSRYAKNPESADFSFIDLFAGIGGIRYPFQKIGGIVFLHRNGTNFPKKHMQLILVNCLMEILPLSPRMISPGMMSC
jgi:DNA (cytosine-5)-methyltransferase 1